MKITLAVFAAPYSSQASQSAYCYAKAALELGHEIYRIFFYQDGVHNASELAVIPGSELDLQKCWQELATSHEIDTVVCAASALKRGVLDQSEANRYNKSAVSMAEHFHISGIGQLIDANINSDRVIYFGA